MLVEALILKEIEDVMLLFSSNKASRVNEIVEVLRKMWPLMKNFYLVMVHNNLSRYLVTKKFHKESV